MPDKERWKAYWSMELQHRLGPYGFVCLWVCWFFFFGSLFYFTLLQSDCAYVCAWRTLVFGQNSITNCIALKRRWTMAAHRESDYTDRQFYHCLPPEMPSSAWHPPLSTTSLYSPHLRHCVNVKIYNFQNLPTVLLCIAIWSVCVCLNACVIVYLLILIIFGLKILLVKFKVDSIIRTYLQ